MARDARPPARRCRRSGGRGASPRRRRRRGPRRRSRGPRRRTSSPRTDCPRCSCRRPMPVMRAPRRCGRPLRSIAPARPGAAVGDGEEAVAAVGLDREAGEAAEALPAARCQATSASSSSRGPPAPAAACGPDEDGEERASSAGLIAPRAPRRTAAAGRRACSGGLGFGFGALGSGGFSASVTHQIASLQPSPGGSGSWSTQPGAPFGQFSRTWKWSVWSHQGRILRSQAASPRPALGAHRELDRRGDEDAVRPAGRAPPPRGSRRATGSSWR